MLVEKKGFIFKRIVILAFIGSLTANFLNKVVSFYDWLDFHRFSGAVNLIFEITLILIAFIFKVRSKYILYAAILLLFFLVGQLFLGANSTFEFPIIHQFTLGGFYQVNNYLFIFLFVAVFNKYSQKERLSYELVNILKAFVYINTIFVILGILTKNHIFYSYPFSERVGYVGLFTSPGYLQYIYMILIIFLYKKYIYTKKIKELLLFIGITLIIGKKGVLLFLGILFIIHFCFVHKYKFIFRTITIFGILISSVLMKDIILFAIKIFPFWESIYLNYGIKSLLLSYRDVLFNEGMLFIDNNWQIINYFIGGDDVTNRVELDIVDLYMFFGALGTILYIFFLRVNFFRSSSYIDTMLVLSIFTVASLSGGLLNNVNLMMYLFLAVNTLNYYEKKKPAEKLNTYFN